MPLISICEMTKVNGKQQYEIPELTELEVNDFVMVAKTPAM